MATYTWAIALAIRLIKKYGAPATLRSFARPADPDSEKPWEPDANAPVDRTVDMVFLDYEQKYIDNTVILAGDQKVYMPAYDVGGTAVAPVVEGVILRAFDDIWKIIAIKPLNPAGSPIIYTLQVRQ